MNVPLEMSFDIATRKEPLEGLIRQRAAKLEKMCDYLSSCRVSVEKKQEHMESGSPYRVRVGLTVPPGHELVATSEPGQGDMHEELATVIIRTFDAAERQLKRLVDKQRGEVKSHPAQEVVGIVSKIFPEQGYGFLQDEAGEEVYFHRNSVLNDEFARMAVGTAARYVAEMGEQGLQASTVQVVGKPGRPDTSRTSDIL